MTKRDDRQEQIMNETLSEQTLYLGKYNDAVNARIRGLEEERFVERMWSKQGAAWKKDWKDQEQITGSLGWIDVAETMAGHIEDIHEVAAEALSAGLTHAVLMGMGGSSLAPLLFQRTFPHGPTGMVLTVLDTTDPATILKIEREIPLAQTLFIVASKSGTTAEPNAFGEYFFSKLSGLKGASAGGNFAAITDPGSPLDDLARKRCFRAVIHNFKDIGGRYSALSYFGLLPAALMGLNVEKLIMRALRMRKACSFERPVPENPGVLLGTAIGVLTLHGVDKLTFLLPESLNALGLWLEQLIAESTGKEGTGILPVADEPLGKASDYSDDRIFVYFSLKGHPDERLEKLVGELITAGRPVITILLSDLFDLAQEFYRWEIATATAGRILGINPFDQPNVQESKDVTNRLLEVVRREGKLPEPAPFVREGDLCFYADRAGDSAPDMLKALFTSIRPSDYVALQAYITETPVTVAALQEMRIALRERFHVATTLGYGPRFLHSTGQYHKGGTNNGIFLQITADDAEDAAIPGTNYTFGVLKRAQAAGDLDALRKRDRRVMRIHLGKDVTGGLSRLLEMVRNI